MLLSCVNCCHNPLQSDGLGARTGYCTSHRVVLHGAHALTCGRLLRKDLQLADAKHERGIHAQHFTTAIVSSLRASKGASPAITIDNDYSQLRRDEIGRIVTDYATAGRTDAGSKMMYLAQLAQIIRRGSGRAELAQYSLGRVYVAHCVEHEGRDHWTSGIHLLQWTKEVLVIDPVVDPIDLPDSPMPQGELYDLTLWELAFKRLVFLSDLGQLAPDDDPVAALRELPELAAKATRDTAFGPLMKWIRRKAWLLVEGAFPIARYQDLHAQLATAAKAVQRAQPRRASDEPVPYPRRRSANRRVKRK